MDALAEIRTRLLKYPALRVEESENSITVLPLDSAGFPVSIHVADEEVVVAFAGWHEHFESAEEALDCFAFGLSRECRLKVFTRGGFAYRWTVESLENGNWAEDSTTGLLFFPFWRRREVVYFQNRVIPAG
ncbi:MAG: hypothetical protein IPH30_03675 [Betaproteobacteria bacterium]|nr:hypothetical protein [Betaproteobacteria bacterium]